MWLIDKYSFLRHFDHALTFVDSAYKSANGANTPPALVCNLHCVVVVTMAGTLNHRQLLCIQMHSKHCLSFQYDVIGTHCTVTGHSSKFYFIINYRVLRLLFCYVNVDVKVMLPLGGICIKFMVLVN